MSYLCSRVLASFSPGEASKRAVWEERQAALWLLNEEKSWLDRHMNPLGASQCYQSAKLAWAWSALAMLSELLRLSDLDEWKPTYRPTGV